MSPPRPVLLGGRLLALALGLVLLWMLLPHRADAAYPGRNGKIAFVGERAGEQRLYVRVGRRTRGLLAGDSLADPVYSPQGRRIALTRETPEEGRGVWILNHDGTHLRRVTEPALAGMEPTWAPHGRLLAYAAGPIGQRTLRVVGADGLGDTQLTFGPEDQHAPAWSSRNAIAFAGATDTGEDIFRVSARGGTPRRLTSKPGDDTDPAWSPRGDRIAFVRGKGGIWTMSPWGRNPRKVVHVPGGIESGVAWSPNGKRILFSGGRAGKRRVYSVRANGKGLRALSLPSSNGHDPDQQPTGFDPLIAASGDIACDPEGGAFNGGVGRPKRCTMMRTSNLMLRSDLWAVLPLGDLQYPTGELGDFYGSFHPTWGRLKSLMRPVPGNHEYRTPGAQGYYDYFNGTGRLTGRAGNRDTGGYHSYDLGAWHVVALNSNCGRIPGGCGLGSAQQRWLAKDLARNRRRCTLAYWHHPLYSSLAREEGRGSRQTQALWQTLYDAGADVVLSGHQHFYERLAPQDAGGGADPVRGIRSFVVGTGGKSLDRADVRDGNSAAFDSDTFGNLELRLHAGSYSWEFRPIVPFTYVDKGRARCH